MSLDQILNTQPTNRTEAEADLAAVYKLFGWKPPEKIVWVTNPKAHGRWQTSAESLRKMVTRAKYLLKSPITNLYGIDMEVVGKVADVKVGTSLNLYELHKTEPRATGPVSTAERQGWNLRNRIVHTGYSLDGFTTPEVVRLSNNVHAVALFEHLAILLGHPRLVKVDDQYRLHSESGPALVWPDGEKLYYIHGVKVPKYMVDEPEKITVELIDKQKNAEIRRVMVDQFGREKFVATMKMVHEDKFGQLFKRQFASTPANRFGEDRAGIAMVKVRNSTPEPDGHHKYYFLRVPFMMKTAHEAVASTFGMTAEQYNPAVET